jgi:hypothetical protein
MRGRHALPQQHQPNTRAHHRCQREDRRGRDRRRGLQPLEHGHEVEREEAAEQPIAPRRRRAPRAESRPGQAQHAVDRRRRDHEPHRVQGGRIDVVGDLAAERKAPRDQRRESQHGQVPAPASRRTGHRAVLRRGLWRGVLHFPPGRHRPGHDLGLQVPHETLDLRRAVQVHVRDQPDPRRPFLQRRQHVDKVFGPDWSHPAMKPIPIPAITASFTARMSEARNTMLAGRARSRQPAVIGRARRFLVGPDEAVTFQRLIRERPVLFDIGPLATSRNVWVKKGCTTLSGWSGSLPARIATCASPYSSRNSRASEIRRTRRSG